MLYYLPGCDVNKNHPIAGKKIQHYMKEKEAQFVRCCRDKKLSLKQDDEVIINCTLCDLVLRETHPYTKRISLYEYVLMDNEFPWVDHHGEAIVIQDCWRTREDFLLQRAVRECLKKMNFKIIEMSENHEKTKYCGVWLYNEPAKDCIDIAPKTMNKIIENDMTLLSPQEQELRMKRWCEQYPINQIAVYCNGCESGIKLGGKTVIHMIELLAEGLI